MQVVVVSSDSRLGTLGSSMLFVFICKTFGARLRFHPERSVRPARARVCAGIRPAPSGPSPQRVPRPALARSAFIFASSALSLARSFLSSTTFCCFLRCRRDAVLPLHARFLRVLSRCAFREASSAAAASRRSFCTSLGIARTFPTASPSS